ncbi:MAG: type II secretion system F family protein [Acidimicrobiia bacterium]
MRQPLVLAALLLWAGTTMLLGGLRWFHRRPLADRLRPHVDGIAGSDVEEGSAGMARVLGPLLRDAGASVARVVGVEEDLARRLERIHSPLDPMTFRVRQGAWALGALAAALVVTIGLAPPPAVALLCVVGAPLLAFLLVEGALARRSENWQRSLQLELPVVSEQLGMMLSAGYSMGAALVRLANRSTGCVARDLKRVVARIGHGVDEVSALNEWADTADVSAVQRLVGVLALDREAGDLGHLITNEARAVRAELHRDLVERIEKRAQQVWVPVTVATLVPGLLFLAVPFADALRLFTGT